MFAHLSIIDYVMDISSSCSTNLDAILDSSPSEEFQDVGKGGLSLRGVAFMTDGFGGFDGSGKHLALLLLLLQNTVPRGSRDGFGGCGGFGRDGYPPLNSTPLFRDPENCLCI